VDIASVDTSATLGSSALHRTHPVAKLIAFALTLAGVVASSNVLVLASVAIVLSSVVLAMRLPARQVFALALYPALFAALFAFAASAGPITVAVLMFKAVTAALCAVTLMFTTPYPYVFAPLQRVMPSLVGDALLMTYRSFFLLLEKLQRVTRAARLRAGLFGRQPVRSARAATLALGTTMLYAVDMSERTYDVMTLRGYDKRLQVTMPDSESRTFDVLTVLVAAALFAVCVAWQIAAQVLVPYAWVPLVAACAIMLLALVYRRTS